MSKLITFMYILNAFIRGFSIKSLRSIKGPVKKDRSTQLECSGKSRIYNLNLTGKGKLIISGDVEIRSLEAHINSDAEIFISDGVYISHGVKISCFDNIKIHSDTLIAPNVVILDNDHVINSNPIKYSGIVSEKVVIGRDCWICANSVIGKGVTMEDHSVLGANSFLRNNVKTYEIYAGSPAVKIRDIK